VDRTSYPNARKRTTVPQRDRNGDQKKTTFCEPNTILFPLKETREVRIEPDPILFRKLQMTMFPLKRRPAPDIKTQVLLWNRIIVSKDGRRQRIIVAFIAVACLGELQLPPVEEDGIKREGN